MKIRIVAMLAVGGLLAALPLLVGGEPGNAAPAATQTSSNSSGPDLLDSATNADDAEQELENAPGQVVATPKASPSGVNLSATAHEVVKLAQAGVDESVMLSYVTNSSYKFALTSDDIIYLNDVGVPGTVVTAMLQRDQAIGGSNAMIASTPPVYTNPTPMPNGGAPTPYPTMENTSEGPPATTQVVEDTAQPPANVSYSYFYDSLSPYGTWINIAGYGPCWQPTVVVANRSWQPYCDRGRWVYSDCGWYWASDYSWGWAPFHYGRWFCHSRFGWCWAPDTVWAPSWVTWRYSDGYCGWAPLPPTACFTPGIGFTFFGRSCGVSFTFGLSASRFCFVPINHFCDRHVGFHRVPPHDGLRVFRDTVVVNQVSLDNHHRIINHGIPPQHIERAIHSELRPVEVRHTDDLTAMRRADRLERGGQTLTSFQPNLPAPSHTGSLVGEGVQASPHHRTPPWSADAAGARSASVGNSGNFGNTSAGVPPLNHRQETPLRPPTRSDDVVNGGSISPRNGSSDPLILRRDRSPISGRERAIGTFPNNNPGNRPPGLNPSTPAVDPTPAPRSVPTQDANPAAVNRNTHHQSSVIVIPQSRPAAPSMSASQPSPWQNQSPVNTRRDNFRSAPSDNSSFAPPSMPSSPTPRIAESWAPPPSAPSHSAPSAPSFSSHSHESHSAPSAPSPPPPSASSHSSSSGNSDQSSGNGHHRDR